MIFEEKFAGNKAFQDSEEGQGETPQTPQENPIRRAIRALGGDPDIAKIQKGARVTPDPEADEAIAKVARRSDTNSGVGQA